VIGSRVIRSGSWVIDGSGFVVDGGGLMVDGSGFVSGCWVIRSGLVSGCWVIRSGLVSGYWCDIRSGLVSGHWCVIRSGLVDGSGVIRSGLIRLGNIRFVMGLTLVSHNSIISVFVVSGVCDNLGSAVGKGNTIFTSDNTVIILAFLFGEISTRVFVFDTIFIREGPGGQFGFWVVWGGMVNGCVVRGGSGVVRSRVVRGMIGHSHSDKRSQQHFAQHDGFFRNKVK